MPAYINNAYDTFENQIVALMRTLDSFKQGGVSQYDFSVAINTNYPTCIIRQGRTQTFKKYIGSPDYTAIFQIKIDVMVNYRSGRLWYPELKACTAEVEGAIMYSTNVENNLAIQRAAQWDDPEPVYGESGAGPHAIRRTYTIEREEDVVLTLGA